MHTSTETLFEDRGFGMSLDWDERLKKRRIFCMRAWSRNKAFVCGSWARDVRVRSALAGFWPTRG